MAPHPALSLIRERVKISLLLGSDSLSWISERVGVRVVSFMRSTE
jgi:hypothetical protein